jgi:putative transposase
LQAFAEPRISKSLKNIKSLQIFFKDLPYFSMIYSKTPKIRKLIYTTNTVEGYHRQLRKVTKNKGVFTSDTALEKLVYLAYRNIREKWTMSLANWSLISQQLAIKFGDRFEIM